MATTSSTAGGAQEPDLDVRGVLQGGIALLLAAVILGAAIALHGALPRREWRAVTPDGRTIITYDRWTGRFHRATFRESGRVDLSDVYTAP